MALIHQNVKNTIIMFQCIVEEPGFKNVKNKHLGMSPF